MEADNDLLRRAAKAAGIDAYWSVDGTIQNRPIFVVKAGGKMGTMPYEEEWNPLRDDATALRLAVNLGLDIMRTEKDVEVLAGLPPHVKIDAHTVAAPFAIELLGNDPYAATRRCIVRAAAALCGGGGSDVQS